MTQKRKRYDKQFKMAAARVVLGGEMRAVDLARELGIKGSTLRLWAQEYEEMGEDARRLQPRLPRRSGSPARFPGVPALPRAPWDRPIHVTAGQPVGRRARGVLLQDAQARAGERQGLQDEEGGEQDVLKYIEPCYNRQRTHSSIGYSAPCDLERDVA